MRYFILTVGALASCAATPATAQTLTLGNLKTPIAKASGKAPAKSVKELWVQINGLPGAVPAPVEPKYWIDCAKEGETCRVPAATRVRYGAGGRFAYRDTLTAILCGNSTFGDPIDGTVKTCAYGSATPAVVTPPPPPPVDNGTPPVAARDKLGINVVGVTYYGNEPVYANQIYGMRWLSNWQGVSNDRLRPDGFPLSVDGTPAAPAAVSFFNPPMESMTTDTAVTRCTWQGTGEVSLGAAWPETRGDHQLTFRWKKAIGTANRVWVQIDRSSASDPIRAMDCRLTTDPADTMFAPSLLSHLKPFGVLRFLDMSAANSNPGAVTWATRSLPGDLVQRGTDATAIENMVALANANGSSPWFTIPWNADADYHRRMAQLVHDSVPAGRPVYVEVSNEVWNYMFGQTGQAEKEGLERKLADARFQAAIYRYAQKVTEVMPIWAEVFKDRPKDLVRVAATQAGNVWVGQNIFEWNGGAAAAQIDAVAIAPYFSIDADHLTDDHAANMTALAAAAKRMIAVSSAEYKALTDKWGKRLIAYEGGQHQLDPGNLARIEAMNRDPAMEGIYRQYLTDWNALTGDLFVLYSATSPISQFGAWGLREYAGQPLSETPKLRGALDFANGNR